MWGTAIGWPQLGEGVGAGTGAFALLGLLGGDDDLVTAADASALVGDDRNR